MIQVGVIGYGYWGPNLARNFHQNSRCRLTKICDMREERQKLAADAFPEARVVADADDLFGDDSIDLIAISTPIETHYELARKALESGKHAFVEKPLTESPAQARELIELAESRGKQLFVDHTFLFTAEVQKIKSIIESGEIGDIWYYDSVRINLGLFQHHHNVVWDLAPHDLSILNYLVDMNPASLIATGACHGGQQLQDVAYLNIDFGNEVIANLHVNWLAPTKIRMIIIGGSEKMIVYNDMNPMEKVLIYDKGIDIKSREGEVHEALIQYRIGDMRAPAVRAVEALRTEMDHVLDCIEGKAKPISDGRFGLGVVEILDAAQRSLDGRGRRIELGS